MRRMWWQGKGHSIQVKPAAVNILQTACHGYLFIYLFNICWCVPCTEHHMVTWVVKNVMAGMWASIHPCLDQCGWLVCFQYYIMLEWLYRYIHQQFRPLLPPVHNTSRQRRWLNESQKLSPSWSLVHIAVLVSSNRWTYPCHQFLV